MYGVVVVAVGKVAFAATGVAFSWGRGAWRVSSALVDVALVLVRRVQGGMRGRTRTACNTSHAWRAACVRRVDGGTCWIAIGRRARAVGVVSPVDWFDEECDMGGLSCVGLRNRGVQGGYCEIRHARKNKRGFQRLQYKGDN